MTNLPKFLAYYQGSDSERKELINSERDPRIKELLLSTDVDKAGVLVKDEVINTILEGMGPELVMRNALPVLNVNKITVRIPYVKNYKDAYAPVVKEGQEIPAVDPENIAYKDFTNEKHGFRPLITREMIEESEFDLIDRELRRVGGMLEASINHEAVETLITKGNHENDVTTEGDKLTVLDIANAIYKIKDKRFTPDTLVLSPIAEAQLLMDTHFLLASYRDEAALRNGTFGSKLLGLNIYTTNIAASTGVNDFGGLRSQDPIAIVYNKEQAASIFMREEIRVERYTDPIRDLVGMTVTNRFGVGVIQEDAIAVIKYGGKEVVGKSSKKEA